MAVRNLDDSNRVFAVEVDMENRTPEEIAKDAALQIGALFDRLIKEQQENEEQSIFELYHSSIIIQPSFCRNHSGIAGQCVGEQGSGNEAGSNQFYR